MIVGSQKPFDEIWQMCRDAKKVLVFGCNTCVAICHAGGEKEAQVLTSMLKMRAADEGVDMQVESLAIQRHCEPEYFEPVMEQVRGYDLVLSTACGVGVNFLSERIGKVQVVPGINTTFFGATPTPGVFQELCAGCGDCMLHMTGGLCPVARCSKTLMNGPCGGTNNGKCEISSEVDCVWFLIVQRMTELGKLEQLLEVRPPRNWSSGTAGGPRRVVLQHVQDLEDAESSN